jgi:hypothetical protein
MDAGAAIERNASVTPEEDFARVLVARETGDRATSRLVEVEAKPSVDLLVPRNRIRRQVLVANEESVIVISNVSRHEAVDNPPEQASLTYDVIGILTGALHIHAIGTETVAHEGLLLE